MKKGIIILLLACSSSFFSQVIKSNSSKITIRDGKEIKKEYWNITPAARPDIYETVSSTTTHKVTFITDVDSISFNVKLNQKISFVVLLNNKDSAYTQIVGVKQLSGVSEFVPQPPFTSSQIKQLSEAVNPFNGVSATKNGEKPNYSDLSPFGNVIGDAQIIALGESTHGTSEFFSMKHRALEYTVVNLNIRVFALEDNQLNVEQINNYVLYGKGKLLNLMRGLFGVWIRQEVVTMIEWIKNYNIEHPDKKVEFVGFDMQNPLMAFDSLNTFLEKRNPELNKKVQEILTEYKKGFQNSYTANEADKTKWFSSTQRVLELMRSEKAK